jgi:hypothetical protein
LLLIGLFEGIESERGIAWRVADSLCLRQFLQIGLDERTPDHVTISRTRRLMDEVTHLEVFGWVLRQVTRAGLLKGKTIGIDATTLEANAVMKSIVRRDTEESYTEHLKRLAEAAGVKASDEAALRRMDRSRKKKRSNAEWVNPHDPEAEIHAHEGWPYRPGRRADVRARLRGRSSAAIVRARKTERAQEAAATSGGVQLGAASPKDDRRRDAASDAGRGGASVASSLAVYLGHGRH